MQMMSSKTVSKTSNGGKKANMMSLMSCDLFLSINSDIWFCLCCCALKIQDVKSRTEFRSRTITEDGVKVLTGHVLDMFVKKANKPTNRWSPGFKSEQNMFVVLYSVPQQLMDQSNLIRDASDQPSGVFMVRTSTRGDSRHFRIQKRGFGSAAAPRGSVCGLITQQSSWRRDEGFS